MSVRLLVRLASVAVVACMLFAVTGCGKDEGGEPGKNDSPQTQQLRKEKQGGE